MVRCLAGTQRFIIKCVSLMNQEMIICIPSHFSWLYLCRSASPSKWH